MSGCHFSREVHTWLTGLDCSTLLARLQAGWDDCSLLYRLIWKTMGDTKRRTWSLVSNNCTSENSQCPLKLKNLKSVAVCCPHCLSTAYTYLTIKWWISCTRSKLWMQSCDWRSLGKNKVQKIPIHTTGVPHSGLAVRWEFTKSLVARPTIKSDMLGNRRYIMKPLQNKCWWCGKVISATEYSAVTHTHTQLCCGPTTDLSAGREAINTWYCTGCIQKPSLSPLKVETSNFSTLKPTTGLHFCSSETVSVFLLHRSAMEAYHTGNNS